MNEQFSSEFTYDKEVNKLLKNIAKGVSKMTLQKFNKAISTLVRKHGGRNSEMTDICNIVCAHFKISFENLKHSQTRGDVYSARIISFFILNEKGFSELELIDFFGCFKNSVSHGIKKFKSLSPDYKYDKNIISAYDAIMLEVDKYYTNNN